jgi:hypothetical protein
VETLDVTDFVGLDLRRLPEATTPRALLAAANVHLSRGRGLAARGSFQRVANVDADSKGLYVVNDQLRCALAYPIGAPVPRPPLNITYDLLSDTGGFSGTLTGVADVTSWDTRPYVCAEVPAPSGASRYRHYYIPPTQSAHSGFATNPTATTVDIVGAPPTVGTGSTVWFFGVPGAYLVTNRVGDTFTFAALPTLAVSVAVTLWSPISNRVALPFEPGPAVEAAEGKIYAPNRIERIIQFSSTVNGPTDWTSVGDAGFLPTTQYPGGDQGSTALAVFNRQLVVFYPLSTQVWTVDPDPQRHAFFAHVGGTGTDAPGSVANIHGDLLYLGQGGFASLSAVITTGQPKAGNVLGEPIAKLTSAVPRGTAPKATWSMERQQYVCAVEQEVFVLTYAPNDADLAAVGWGRWELPWPVSDVVEWQGDIYVRRADAPEIWKLLPDGEGHADEVVSWSWKCGFADFGGSGYGKAIRTIDVHARGFFTLSVQTDPTETEAPIDLGTIDVGTGLGGIGKMMVVLTADYLQLAATGAGRMDIDGYAWRYEPGGLL